MKCPICGQELTVSKKDPNYLLCYNCKKKFRVPEKNQNAGGNAGGNASQSAQRAQTAQARQTATRERQRQADSYEEEYDENDGYLDEDEHLSRVPIIVLGVAIVIVLGLIIFMLVQ